jgi:hypothetical protein
MISGNALTHLQIWNMNSIDRMFFTILEHIERHMVGEWLSEWATPMRLLFFEIYKRDL